MKSNRLSREGNLSNEYDTRNLYLIIMPFGFLSQRSIDALVLRRNSYHYMSYNYNGNNRPNVTQVHDKIDLFY